jgi:uncharacterized protein YqfA (UPF0365 family)
MPHVDTGLIAVFAFVAVGFFALLLVCFLAVARPWLRAKMTGGRASIFDIIGMRLRGSPPSLLIDAYQSLLVQGVEAGLGEVERAYIVNRGRVATADDLVQIVREAKRVG